MVAGAAGVVDHDVDAAELLDGRVDDPLAVLADLGVAGDEHGGVAGVHLLEGLLALLLVAAVDDDLGALPDERLGDRPPDASGTAGDGRDLPLQLHRRCPLR